MFGLVSVLVFHVSLIIGSLVLIYRQCISSTNILERSKVKVFFFLQIITDISKS